MDPKSAGAMFLGCLAFMMLIGIPSAVYAVINGAAVLAGFAIVGVFVVIAVVLWVFLLSASTY
jgi:hypothetical protein